MERRLAAILAADVVGYTRLMGADEAGTISALKTLRTNFIEPLIEAHRGRIVKLMGDGLLVEFQSVVDAVECAIGWQTRQNERPGGVSLQFRIGINSGDIVIDEGDIYGAAADYARKALADNAANVTASHRLVCALGHKGDLEGAKAALESSRRYMPDPTLAYFEAAYAFTDRDTLDFFLAGLRKAGWDG